MKNSALYRVLFWVWVVVEFFLTTTPNLSNPKINLSSGTEFRLDYFGHAGVFLLMSFLFVMGYSVKLNSFRKILIPAVFILLFSVLEELKQIFIADRTFNIYDLIFNMIGVIVGMPLFYLIVEKYSNKKA